MRSIVKAKGHLGVGRLTNEDVCLVDEALGLYAVCDGSRDVDGRWAAETICSVLQRELRKHSSALDSYKAAPSKPERAAIEIYLKQAIQRACGEVHRACYLEKTRKPSSSALGVVLFLGDYAISVHVGNTRLYLVRGGKPLRLTQDHTYYEEMLRQVQKGGQVNPAFKKRLTHAIGDSEFVPLAVTAVPLMAGDLLVLCSNGLSDYLNADGSDLVALCAEADVDQITERLLSWALDQKSDDNITALVARISSSEDTLASKTKPIQSNARKQLELLRSLKVFAAIRDDQQAMIRIQGLLTFRRAQKGETIVQQGSPSDEMFMMISGQSEVRVNGKVIAHRKGGDVIGEMGFFDRRLRSATVIATEPTELASIQRWEYDALVQQDWRLGYKIQEAVIIAMAEKLEESSAASSRI